MTGNARRSALAVVVLLLLPAAASACPVCWGGGDSQVLAGMNRAILFLLGCVGVVFAGFGKVIWDIHRRIRQRERLRLIDGGARG
jgi:hypothetical protein